MLTFPLPTFLIVSLRQTIEFLIVSLTSLYFGSLVIYLKDEEKKLFQTNEFVLNHFSSHVQTTKLLKTKMSSNAFLNLVGKGFGTS